MNMKKLATSSVCTVLILSGCSPCYRAKTSTGAEVCLPHCKHIVKYSGKSLSIGEATLPIPKSDTSVNIKGVSWDTKKLQEAAPAMQLMDNQHMAFCERLNRDIQTLRYEDYRELRFKMEDLQTKLDQLALLILMNDAKGVERWIDTYLTSDRLQQAEFLKQAESLMSRYDIELPSIKLQPDANMLFFPKDIAPQPMASF